MFVNKYSHNAAEGVGIGGLEEIGLGLNYSLSFNNTLTTPRQLGTLITPQAVEKPHMTSDSPKLNY